MRVPYDDLIGWGTRLLESLGLPPSSAQEVSASIVEAEAFRETTHGVVQFQALADKVGRDISPLRPPQLLKDSGPAVLIDGRMVPGALCMRMARDLALQKAPVHGVCFIGIQSTHWIGALGPHLIKLAERGLLAVAWAQTSNAPVCAPFGGVDARFNTNPMALAFPAPNHPVVSDFSTTSMSVATQRRLLQRGAVADTARFLDTEGYPSSDPGVVPPGGTILFTGLDTEGYKFFGLSLFIEALTALCGGRTNDPATGEQQTVACLALDPQAFGGREHYDLEITRFLDRVKSSRVRPGFDAIHLPGERGFAALAKARLTGVPLDEAKCRMLSEVSKTHGLSWPWF